MRFAPKGRALFRHVNFQKMLRTPCALYILTWKCASRHTGVRLFFDIWTSKSGPNIVCVVRILTSKSASRHTSVRLFFDIWTSKSGPNIVCVLRILTSKCASRHNGVQFFISDLARWLCTRRFSEPTFRPSGATNDWKNTANRDFSTFSRACIFFLLALSLLWSSFFSSSLHWPSAFASVHIVGSLTSKLPSITLRYTTSHYIQQLWLRWPLQPLQPLQKTHFQPPFGPSVGSLCHPYITTTHLSYSVLSSKLPPPPCAVLLVSRSSVYYLDLPWSSMIFLDMFDV